VVSAPTDHVLDALLYSVFTRGSWAATPKFKHNPLAPIRAGVVRAEANIISMTKRTAVVRVNIPNDDRTAAAAQGTVAIVAPRCGPPPPWGAHGYGAASSGSRSAAADVEP
jgi:acyl-coenzyme A thioesterase PaaI-like protein